MMSAKLSPARAILAAFLLFLATGPLWLPEFHVTLLNYIGLYGLVALGLVLLTGVGGLTSFGQAAFVGLGAYTTAYLTTAYGVSPWLTLLAGLGLTLAQSFVQQHQGTVECESRPGRTCFIVRLPLEHA